MPKAKEASTLEFGSLCPRCPALTWINPDNSLECSEHAIVG